MNKVCPGQLNQQDLLDHPATVALDFQVIQDPKASKVDPEALDCLDLKLKKETIETLDYQVE